MTLGWRSMTRSLAIRVLARDLPEDLCLEFPTCYFVWKDNIVLYGPVPYSYRQGELYLYNVALDHWELFDKSND